MTEQKVKEWFVAAIDNHPGSSPELKRALRNRKQMINNYVKCLHVELQKAARHMMMKKGKTLKTDTYKSFVAEMADNFVKVMEKNANERIQSEIKRLSIEKTKQDAQDLESTFNGKPQGDLKEYIDEGSLILDETKLQRPNTTIKN